MAKPKDGDIVFFKTKDGTIIRGTLKGKTVHGGGKSDKKYRPPLSNVYKTLAEAQKSTWRPKGISKKEWDVLGAEPKKRKSSKDKKK